MNTRHRIGTRAPRWLLAAVLIVTLGGVTSADAKDKEKKREGDRAQSGYIGVYMQDLTDDVRKGLDLEVTEGVLVSGVADDSPAAKAGLEDGDVILRFDGKKVTTPEELRQAVRAVEPGRETAMEVVQDGKTKTLTITVGERPDEAWGLFSGDGPRAPELRHAFAAFAGPRLGIQAHEMSDELASYFKAKGGEGILVLGVDAESVAGAAGVKEGDVVQKIGDREIGSIEDLRSSLRDFEEGSEFTITVLRKGKTQSLKATMDDQSSREYSWMFHDGSRGFNRLHRQMMRAPREAREDLRKELDELREELEQLKEKIDSRAD